ncbi:MAG TPA: hypothetical protein VIZ20_06085 [Streptosporangiaceae bacterium]|jgi:hypothetical protein
MTPYHWLMTLQGGSATQPVTMSFSGVTEVDSGDSRLETFTKLFKNLADDDEYSFVFSGGAPAVVFFSLEPDSLG